MAKLILEHDDGTQEVLKTSQPNDGYIAMKLWSFADVYTQLQQHPDADDYTHRFINLDELKKRLEAATDKDWKIIDIFIDNAVDTQRIINHNTIHDT